MNGADAVQHGSDGVVDIFLNQGVLGALVLLLLFAVWKLWQKLQEAQEKQLEMAVQVTKAVDAATSALERNTDAFESMKEGKQS